MENTLENKAKFFAQYLFNCAITSKPIAKYKITPECLYAFWRLGDKGDSVLLTPLSQITDEDAIEVAKIICKDIDNTYFLVSKGYSKGIADIPFKDIICIEVSRFINYPSDGRYYLSNLIQIDIEICDIICGVFENDGKEFKDGTADYIGTNWNVATNSSNYTQNSASVSLYIVFMSAYISAHRPSVILILAIYIFIIRLLLQLWLLFLYLLIRRYHPYMFHHIDNLILVL